MGLFDGIKKRENENIDGFNDYTDGDTMWIPNNDEIPEYVEEEPVNTQNSFGGINEAAVSLKLVTPKSLADTAKIADYLIAGSSVVLNIEEMEDAEIVRFMDYLQGVLYIIKGNMKQVSKTTFVATPNNVGIDSETSDEDITA